jgi:hypothetical protein
MLCAQEEKNSGNLKVTTTLRDSNDGAHAIRGARDTRRVRLSGLALA